MDKSLRGLRKPFIRSLPLRRFCPNSLFYNQLPCYRMTQLFQRLGAMVLVLVMSLLITSLSPMDSEAKKRHSGKAKKLSHNVSKSGAKKTGKKSRYAKASKNSLVRLARIKSDKLALAEKIKQLSTSQLVADEPVIGASEASQLDIEAELAQAAKEEMEEDDIEVSIEQFFRARPGTIGADDLDPDVIRSRQVDFTLYDEADPTTAAKRSDVMQNIIDWMGTRYVFGGVGRNGIDCSAFTREVFQKSFGIELPRTAHMQSRLGESVRKNELQFGDLVFFQTARYAPVTHVGIYIGEGYFANAASSKGVSLGSLDSKYWNRRYLGAKRLFTNTTLAGSQTGASNLAHEPSHLNSKGLVNELAD